MPECALNIQEVPGALAGRHGYGYGYSANWWSEHRSMKPCEQVSCFWEAFHSFCCTLNAQCVFVCEREREREKVRERETNLRLEGRLNQLIGK